MFAAWGRFVYRRRWPVLLLSILLLLASGFIAGRGGKLESGGTWQVTIVAQKNGQTLANRQMTVNAEGGM